ncbi:MAG: alpha-glucosidase [Lachnospiraceae bacterium]|nr:alpha-glucosidase [Lachnospiraceae bacterium]
MTKKWWHDKVAYQIYPKSFFDSNGDGIGDLPGIISKLDYLQELGVDILWLSPCYQSPLADQGYDISDYYKIDPRFGTMEDMDCLIAEARKRGMYILMDLVVNHCSDEHLWFQKARQDPEGPYGNFFYLTDKVEGKLPTNWRSYFGGSVWEDLPGTGKQYLHVFHKKQPDLNWENPQVREEIYKNICWWLDKGLGGFRLDAIINIKKALPMRDYEPDREDGLCSMETMLKEASGIGQFLGEMRDRTFRKYDVFTVGEVFNEKPEEIPDFIGENGYFSSMFDFNETIFGASEKGWYASRHITPEEYRRCCFDAQARVGTMGFLSNIIENHDEPRGVSRYIPERDCCPESKKMLAGLNFLLRGIPFIYQGQELGMENVPFTSIDEIDDISTLDEYRTAREAGLSEEEALKAVAFYSRDNARTPMQWSGDAHAGFTTGTPWLRVNPNYTTIHAAAQMKDPDSVRSFYKQLIALRKSPEYKETIVYGTLEPVWEEQPNLMAYYRKGERTLLVMGNFQRERRSVVIPGGYKKVLLNNYKELGEEGEKLFLNGYQFLVLEV